MTKTEKLHRQIDSLTKTVRMRLALNRSMRTEFNINEFFHIAGGSKDPVEKWDELIKEKAATLKRKVDEDEQNKTHAEQASKKDDKLDEQQEELGRHSVFNPKFPDQACNLLTQASHGCNQLETARTLFDNIFYHGFTGQQVIAQAGAGKTYLAGSLIKNLNAQGFFNDCLSPMPVLYVTKSTIVEQTMYEVLKSRFNIDCFGLVTVINIEALRSSLLGVLIDKTVNIIDGQEHEGYVWRTLYKPKLVIWDESQGLARAESTQSKIANSLILPPFPPWKTHQVDMSATPWSRVCEAKHFAVSTGLCVDTGLGSEKVTSETWPRIARDIADPSQPDEHCTAAIKRFVDHFESHIVRISNIRPRHKSYNSVVKIDFPTQVLKDEYYKALESFEKKREKITSNDSLTDQQKYVAVLAEYTIFRKAAENCRREFCAEWFVDKWDAGYAPGIGFSFKQTGRNICELLIKKYKWKRSDISIIWGGATEALTAKKKLAKKIKDATELRKAAEEAGISFEDDLGIYLDDFIEKTDEQIQFEKDYDLLTQKPEDRERERLAFQTQTSRVAMFSYKSGGVGLSLHHEEQYPNARQRVGMFTPVYSEKELVQALGRFPRITSASDTDQTMCYYAGTIEEHVAAKVIQKLKCLKEAIRGHESWEDIITKLPKRGLEEYEHHTKAADEVESDGGVGLVSEFREEI